MLTFGKVEPRPNTVNVVPGKTTFTIDCRHTDAAVLRDFTQQLENDMRAICDEMDIGIDIDLWMDEEPVPMNKELVATLTELCESEKTELPGDAQWCRARRANFRASRADLHDFYPQHQRDQP